MAHHQKLFCRETYHQPTLSVAKMFKANINLLSFTMQYTKLMGSMYLLYKNRLQKSYFKQECQF
jgi:hypothetical protein